MSLQQHCILGTNNTIDNLVKETGLPLEIVKTKIISWRILNNDSESYPTAKWIKDNLNIPIDKVFDTNTINIYAGTNENADLSNFAERPFNFDDDNLNVLSDFLDTINQESDLYGALDILAGESFKNVESAFQAAKLAFSSDNNRDVLDRLKNTTGTEARTIGRNLKNLDTKRWDKVSSDVMRFLIKASFEQNPQALQRLLSTGNAILTHTKDKGKWGAEFPRLLMEVRSELRQEHPELSQYSDNSSQETKTLVVTGNAGKATNGNFEISQEDYNLSQVEFNIPGMPSGMTITESPQSKIYREFGSNLENRVSIIARDFEASINYLIGKKIKEFNNELDNHRLGRSINGDLLQIQYNIEVLKEYRPEDREYIISIIGRDNILNHMVEIYQKYAKNGKSGVDKEYSQIEYQKVLDNFNELYTEASELIKSLTGFATQLDSNEYDSDGENGASGNEGWGVKMHLVNLKDIVSAKTKSVLYRIPMYKSDGKSFERDDLGNVIYMNGEFARKVIVEIMSNITSPEEFNVYDKQQGKYTSFPVLEKAANKYKWLNSVISYLKRNDDYVDSFYSDMRNVFIEYRTVKESTNTDIGNVEDNTITLNGRSNTEYQLDLIQSTISEGIVLNKDYSIYNNNGKINPEGYKKFKYDKQIEKYDSLVNQLKSTDEITKKFVNEFSKLFDIIGYSVNKELFYESMKNLNNFATIVRDIYSKIKGILKNIETNSNNEDYFIFKGNRTYYKEIAELTGIMDGLYITLNFRQNGKSYTSYSKPNAISMLLGRMLNFTAETFDWYASDRIFLDNNGRFLFDMMNDIKEKENVRDKVKIFHTNTLYGKDYDDWNAEDIYKSFIHYYFNNNPEKMASYNSPILSDSPISIFFTLPKYVSDSKGSMEQKLLPKFRNIVLFEMNRMKRIEDLNKEGVKDIANYNHNKKGTRFWYFPELNTLHANQITRLILDLNKNVISENIYESDKLFIDYYRQLLQDGNLDAANELIDNAVEFIMNQYFTEFRYNISKFEDNIKKDLVSHNIVGQNEDISSALKEFFWNNTFALMNIIAMFGIDPAYTKDGVDFQKRWKQIYASGWKLNTAGKYGKKTLKVLYLSDEVFRSKKYDEISFACDKLLKEHKISLLDKENILRIFNEVNNSDALALRSLKSFKQIMQMLGKWDEIKDSVDGLYNGNWTKEDFNKVYQTIKPFMYCIVQEDDGLGGKQLVPHHNKNSEFLLLAMFDIVNANLRKSPKLKGLSRFMEESGIDVVMYESAVKLGCSNPINLNYSRKKVLRVLEDGYITIKGLKFYIDVNNLEKGKNDFDKIMHTFEKRLENNKDGLTQNIVNEIYDKLLMDEQETYDYLVLTTGRTSGSNGQYSFDDMVIKEQPLDFWSVIQPTPQHYFDTRSVEGSLERNITPADLPDDFNVNIHGVNLNKEQILNAYNAVFVEDDLCSLFGELDKNGVRRNGFIHQFIQDGEFNIERFIQTTQRQIAANDKYSRLMKEAVQLVNVNGIRKTRLSTTSPQMYLLQEIMFSLSKNNIIARKTNGGSAILVSDIGLTNELKVVYEYTDGSGKEITFDEAKRKGIDVTSMRLKYVECYLPYPKQIVYEKYLKKVTRKAVLGDGTIYEEEYYELDYDKLKKDCPEALDAIGMRIPTENKYSITPLRIKGFLPKNNGSAIMVASDITAITGCDFDVDKMFLYFKEVFFNNKTNKLDVVRYDMKGLFNKDGSLNLEAMSKLTEKQRTNLKFDLKKAVLTSKYTLALFQNPGNFNQLKKYARISYLLQNKELLEEFWKQNEGKDKFEILFGSDLNVFDDFLKKHDKERNIATIDTYVYNHHQNMSGGKLIGVYAVGNSQHVKYQNSDISLIKPLYIDNKEIVNLDNIMSRDGDLYITKLLAEFLAASVDNVKDPVLANMLQNLNTANFAIWMIRMGFNMQDVTLVFNNPYLKESFDNNGDFNSISRILTSMINQIDDKQFKKEIRKINSITTQELFDAIQNNEWFGDNKIHIFDEINNTYKYNTIKVLSYINNMIILSKPIGALTRISKYDSPKNAPSTLASSMKNYLEVDKFNKKSEDYSKMYSGLGAATNNDIVSDLDNIININIDELRLKLINSGVPITLAAYTLGYLIPMLLMSQLIFKQNNSNIREQVIKFNDIHSDSMSDELLSDFYERYTYYNLTKTKLFGDDENMSFAEKYKYYTLVFPSAFIQLKKERPDIVEKYLIMNMLDVYNNRIILRKSGRLTKDERDVLMRNLDNMLFSEDKQEYELATRLFMYSFYREKCGVDHSSFNQLFSVQFIECFPEFNEECENFVENSNDEFFRNEFEKQFIYNNADLFFKEIQLDNIDRFPLNDGIVLLKEASSKYVMVNRNSKSSLLIDFGNNKTNDKLSDMMFLERDDSDSNGVRYFDITSTVNTIRQNELYYAGNNNIDEVASIINNPYKKKELVYINSNNQQDLNNIDTEISNTINDVLTKNESVLNFDIETPSTNMVQVDIIYNQEESQQLLTEKLCTSIDLM